MEHAKIFLGHTTVSVISGLQAKTVRLTLMNVAVETVATRTRVRVVALTSMNPTALVQNAKDLNASVGMASQVCEINLVIKGHQVSIISLKLANSSQITLSGLSGFPV